MVRRDILGFPYRLLPWASAATVTEQPYLAHPQIRRAAEPLVRDMWAPRQTLACIIFLFSKNFRKGVRYAQTPPWQTRPYRRRLSRASISEEK